MIRPRILAVLFAAGLMVPRAVDASSQSSDPAPDLVRPSATHCAAFQAQVELPDVRVTAADAIAPVAPGSAAVQVAHCKVSGVIGREIRFELLLPDRWNRRFVMGGGGGFVGRIDNQAIRAVNDGFATVGTDTGHQGIAFKADWAHRNLERQVNFAHLAVHRVAVTAKALVRLYYSERPRFSYFEGCSNGGRQALMEAQRYPDDFDGIIAGAPAISFTRIAAAFVRNAQALFPTPQHVAAPIVTPEAVALLDAQVRAACDASDGVTDGIVADPRRCRFDPARLPACSGDRAGADCVTAAQRNALARVYEPVMAGGEQVYTAAPVGNEGELGGWPAWITGPNKGTLENTGGRAPSLQFAFGTEIFKHFVFHDPEWDYTRYDFTTWRRDTEAVRALVDADKADLQPFTSRGGRLLLWHGWSDAALSAYATIEYHDAVLKATPDARSAVRLFLAPGVLHCFGGPGAGSVPWLSILADWVERQRPPERVVGRRLDPQGTVVRTRPLCAHPAEPAYSGTGNPDDEASFVCRTP
jgi:feruloyl esterase